MPNVSVIMPSYNHERYISEAIDSVLNQTFTDFELIIIDDASKDKSKEIIKVYAEKDSRIRAFFHSENKGIARTMNECLEKADGKFIAFFASDDVWVKDKLEKQLEVLAKDEDLIVWSEGLIIDAQGDPTGELWTARFESKRKSGYLFEELLKGNFICGQSRIIKKRNIGDIKFNEALKYRNDYQFEVDLSRKYEYYFIPEPLAMYRVHGTNTTLSDTMGWQKDNITIGVYFLHKYGNEISNTAKCRLNLDISGGYSYIEEKAKARRYVYHAIKLNPFYWANIPYLLIALINDDRTIRNILRWCIKTYKECVEWIQKSQ